MRIRNPYRDDPRFEYARVKWGEPSIITVEDDGCRYECMRCRATWVGPIADHCDWCHERWETERAARVASLLHPAWMVTEGVRFDALTPVYRDVWNATRGIRTHPYSERQWAIDVVEASHSGLLTRSQAANALMRYRKWTQRTQSMPLTRET